VRSRKLNAAVAAVAAVSATTFLGAAVEECLLLEREKADVLVNKQLQIRPSTVKKDTDVHFMLDVGCWMLAFVIVRIKDTTTKKPQHQGERILSQ